MRITRGQKLTVKNNLFIGALERTELALTMLYDMTCFIYWWKNIDVTKDEIVVTQNVGQGSQGPGYIFPHILCS